MKMKLLAGLIAGVLLSGVSGLASADVLVDRGLPTSNLNNVSGSNRSNVAWVDGGYTPANYWMVGDTFTNASSQTWSINTIRLWTVGATSTATLWGGTNPSAIGVASASGAISNTTYAGGAFYQNTSGTFSNIYQVDFAVNITLAAGQTYDFFLDGSGGNYTIPFVHASNSALSGSLQQGADDSMLWANVVGGSVDPLSVQAWSSLGNGWDKASDVNVQVIGAPIPEPETYAMLLAGLGLLGVLARRRKQHEAVA